MAQTCHKRKGEDNSAERTKSSIQGNEETTWLVKDGRIEEQEKTKEEKSKTEAYEKSRKRQTSFVKAKALISQEIRRFRFNAKTNLCQELGKMVTFAEYEVEVDEFLKYIPFICEFLIYENLLVF